MKFSHKSKRSVRAESFSVPKHRQCGNVSSQFLSTPLFIINSSSFQRSLPSSTSPHSLISFFFTTTPFYLKSETPSLPFFPNTSHSLLLSLLHVHSGFPFSLSGSPILFSSICSQKVVSELQSFDVFVIFIYIYM